jgi:antitoxin (DNA-binding transcriptional repressor) of toxin-antitoxin stability system
MKAIPLPKELQPFVEVAEAAGEEPLVFTAKKRPVAMLVALRKVDRESWALSTNPEFLRIIETARKEIRAGQTTSLEEVERKLKRTTSNKRAAPHRRPVADSAKPERTRVGSSR